MCRLIFIFLFLFVSNANGDNPSKKLESVAGVYGVGNCNSNKKEGLKSPILLKLNEDHTFNFFDSTNPKSGIQTSGTWELQENKIVLAKTQSDLSIPQIWKIYNSYTCLKTRRKFEFIRICKIN